MKQVQISKLYPNIRDCYYITDEDKVININTGREVKQNTKERYIRVSMLKKDGKCTRLLCHRLKMMAFNPVENMENLQVNHIDGNKKNNNLTNLEWTTSEENIRHAIDNNLRATINGASKLTPEQVIEIYRRATNGERNIDLGKEFNIHPDQVGRIKNKKAWKEITSSLV